MNNCEIVKDLLPMYIDGLCSETSNKLVEQHLSTCTHCQQIYEQMLNEFEVEQIELNTIAIQQRQPFEKLNHIFKSYRFFSKMLEWLTVLAIVITVILVGKGFIDTQGLNAHIKHQKTIEQEQQNIMNTAFEKFASEGTAGLEKVSTDYQNKIKYIAVFDAADVEPLAKDYAKPKAVYPLSYEKAIAVYESGQLVTESTTPSDYDIGTMVMEKGGYIVQFEYARHYLMDVETAFQTKHYSPTIIQLWLPALIALVVSLCSFFLYRKIKDTNRRAQKLIS